MKAGQYWVGDLCYVMGSDWQEVCSKIITKDDVLVGEFELADGTKFALMCTAYGDGTYSDQDGKMYSVDAGLIGCILVEDIKDVCSHRVYHELGHIINFSEDFTVSSDEGWINFGDLVSIDTAQEESDDEDYYCFEDDVDIEDDEEES